MISGIYYVNNKVDSELNQLGEQGWELVSLTSIINWNGYLLATMKRKKLKLK